MTQSDWRRFTDWSWQRRRRLPDDASAGADIRYRCPRCRSWDVEVDETRPRGSEELCFDARCRECGQEFLG